MLASTARTSFFTARCRRSYGTSKEPNQVDLATIAGFSKARSQFFRHPWLETLREIPSLSHDTRILTFLSGNTTSGNMAALSRDWAYLPMTRHANGAEALLLGLVTAGMPKTLNAFSTVASLGILSKVCCEPSLAEFEQQKTNDVYKRDFSRGEERLKLWRGKGYPRFRRHLRLLHPALDRMLVEVAFGRVHSRGVLPDKDANLCVLMAMSGQISFPQLHAFLTDIVSSGSVSIDEARAILDQTERVFGEPAQAVADAAWTDISKQQLLQKPSDTDAAVAQLEPFVWSYGTEEQMKRCTEASAAAWEDRCQRFASGVYGTGGMGAASSVVTFRQPPSLPSYKLTCGVLGAHAAAGNMTLLAQGWSALPREFHRMGLEAILQSSIFGGYFNTVNALETVHRMGVSVEAIDFRKEDREAASQTPAQVVERGKAAMAKIYTKMLGPLLEKIGSQHPDLVTLIVDAIYGRVLSRPCEGLQLKDRELWAILCMAGGTSYPQLHSHMLGALHCGSTLAEIRCALDQTQRVWGREAQVMVDAFWLAFERSELRRVHSPNQNQK